MQISIILTEAQADLIRGKEYTKGCFFNPIKDAYDHWIISFEELISIEDISFVWLWECPFDIYFKPYSDNIILQ